MPDTTPATDATTGAAGASRPSPVRGPILVGGIVLAGVVLLALHDPHVSGSYGYCPLYALTGLWCPACGGLRATHDLARGDVAAAWGMNPLWVVVAPLLVLAWGRWVATTARGRRPRPLPAALPWVLAAVALSFGILRNVPVLAPYLAP